MGNMIFISQAQRGILSVGALPRDASGVNPVVRIGGNNQDWVKFVKSHDAARN